jgi:hypothetical protein
MVMVLVWIGPGGGFVPGLCHGTLVGLATEKGAVIRLLQSGPFPRTAAARMAEQRPSASA